MNDTLCGLPLKLDGGIDWPLVGRAWAANEAIGPIHDHPRPVRLPLDPRSDMDMVIYGEALVQCSGRIVSVYR